MGLPLTEAMLLALGGGAAGILLAAPRSGSWWHSSRMQTCRPII